MTPADIPEDVLRFIRSHIDTVPHLEALLLVWESAPKEWTTEELAARLYVDVANATRISNDLTRLRMFKSTDSGFAYDPTGEHADILPRVAESYRRQLVQVARFIHSKGSAEMQEFARAFKFKPDER